MNDEEMQQEEIERTAAEWLVRLGGSPLGSAERAAFESWLADNPAHRQAYEDTKAAWAEFDVLKANPGQLRAVVAPPQVPSSGRVRNTLIVAGLLICGLAGLTYRIGDPWIALTADFHTAAGEVRTVGLPDGSSVDLGASSAIAIEFSDDVRQVRLLAGEAFFRARPKQGSEQRPFSVVAAGGRTTALGTQFLVEEIGDLAAITAVEHRIEVSMASQTRAPGSVVLSPGDTVRYSAEGGLGAVGKAVIARVAAWRQGMLVFDSAPLGDVVATLNRYRRGRIVVMNGALAQRRVSGVFPADDLANVVDTIAKELGASVVSAPPLLTLLY